MASGAGNLPETRGLPGSRDLPGSKDLSGSKDLEEEHHRLSQAWIDAEQYRISILQGIIHTHAAMCTMDYPEGLFTAYEDALFQASQASRAYTQWLAEQGFQSK